MAACGQGSLFKSSHIKFTFAHHAFLVQCQPVPECDKSRCQLVNDAHGCPFCSCPPVVHPPPTFVLPSTNPH
jgi:hypothetical protein